MSDEMQRALGGAASMGNVEVAKKAIEGGADPKANQSEALYVAATRGHAECVEFLIPLSNPKDYASAMNMAALEGHVECVRALMNVVDPKTNRSMALQNAACAGQWDCMRLLIPVSDLEDMKNDKEWLMQEHGIANLQAFIEEESLRATAVAKTPPKNVRKP